MPYGAIIFLAYVRALKAVNAERSSLQDLYIFRWQCERKLTTTNRKLFFVLILVNVKNEKSPRLSTQRGLLLSGEEPFCLYGELP